MAGDWIKFRKKLIKDGRVRELSRTCHADRVTVLGALVTLWCLADDYAEDDGYLPGYTPEDIDAEVGLEGFTRALPEDWCSIKGDKLYLPNYTEHNGETSKKRSQQAKRQARHRAAKAVTQSSQNCHAPSVTEASPREEKRREEEKREESTEEILSANAGVASDSAKDELLSLEGELVALWNESPGVVKNRGERLTDSRRRMFRARCRDPGWDWRTALGKFPLRCLDPNGWKPDLDWFLKPDSVQKILEGKYDWAKTNGQPMRVGLGQQYAPDAKLRDPNYGKF